MDHQKRLEKLKAKPNDLDSKIQETETILKKLGIDIRNTSKTKSTEKGKTQPVIHVPKWEDVYLSASQRVSEDIDIEMLFSEDELKANSQIINQLNQEYNMIHRLDKVDYSIAIGAGMLGALVDILLVGLPESKDVETKPLSGWIRKYFEEKYSTDEIKKLERHAKVSYDANHNAQRGSYLEKNVQGLTPQFHRLLSLGHDPLLGFVVGVIDIMNGNMTTIDKSGTFVIQNMSNYLNYKDRQKKDIVEAIVLQFNHLKTDVATPAGLPVPLMGLFNLFQFGKFGDENQTIAEIVQGMYYEGYDYIHFCSMSIPVMITEIITRVGYALKEIKEGKSIEEAIKFSTDRKKHPKIGTMLFLANAVEVTANAGKVYFTKNPTSINYPQWCMFAQYAYKQLKWGMLEKPEFQKQYVDEAIETELFEVYRDIQNTYDKINTKYRIVMD